MPLRAPPPMNPWLWSRTLGRDLCRGTRPAGHGAAPARRAAGGAAGHGLRRVAVLPPAPPRPGRRAAASGAGAAGGEGRADAALRRLGHRPADHPRRRRRLPARARPPGRCLSGPLPGVDQFGHQRRAGHLRAGRAEPGGLRCARRAAPARHTQRRAAVAGLGRSAALRLRRRHRRALCRRCQHRPAAAHGRGGAVDVVAGADGAELFGAAAAGRAGRGSCRPSRPPC